MSHYTDIESCVESANIKFIVLGLTERYSKTRSTTHDESTMIITPPMWSMYNVIGQNEQNDRIQLKPV